MVSSEKKKNIAIIAVICLIIAGFIAGRAIYSRWYEARFVSIIDVVDTSDIENGFVSVKVEHDGVRYDTVYTADLNKYGDAFVGRYALENYKDYDVRFFLLEDAFDPSADSFTVRRLIRATQ